MLSGNLELFALADVLRFVARSGATGRGQHLPSSRRRKGPARRRQRRGSRRGRLRGGGSGWGRRRRDAAHGRRRRGLRARARAGLRADDASRSRTSSRPWVAGERSGGRSSMPSGRSMGRWRCRRCFRSGSAEITLTPLEWHIAVLFDGRRSLREIAHEAGASEFAAATALLAMSNAGLLELQGSPTAGDAESESYDEDEGADDGSDEEDLDDGGTAYEDDEAGSPAAEDGSDAPEDGLDPGRALAGARRAGRCGRRAAGWPPRRRQEQRIHLRSR